MHQPVIRTAVVVVGPFVDDAGEPWRGEVTVTSSTPRVWAATGAVVAPRPVPVVLAADGTATLDLPVTDQPGFTDGAGRALTGWTYTVDVVLDGAPYARHTFALPSRVSADGPVRLVVLPDGGSVAAPAGAAAAPGATTPGPAPVADPRPEWPALTGTSTTRPAPAPARERALSRRETFRAGAVALGAAALTG
ncbi:hypothetical protein ACWFNE_21180, partial [Cellulomonas sp. NPDC055163]